MKRAWPEGSRETRLAPKVPCMPLPTLASLQAGNAALGTEIATMQFIREHSGLAVPRVFAYALDENNPAAVAYMLIEALPGIVAMDALGGYKVLRGVIPTQYRRPFYRSVATCHVPMVLMRTRARYPVTPVGELEQADNVVKPACNLV